MEIYTPGNEDVLIVEHPELRQINIPTPVAPQRPCKFVGSFGNLWLEIDRQDLVAETGSPD